MFDNPMGSMGFVLYIFNRLRLYIFNRLRLKGVRRHRINNRKFTLDLLRRFMLGFKKCVLFLLQMSRDRRPFYIE